MTTGVSLTTGSLSVCDKTVWPRTVRYGVMWDHAHILCTCCRTPSRGFFRRITHVLQPTFIHTPNELKPKPSASRHRNILEGREAMHNVQKKNTRQLTTLNFTSITYILVRSITLIEHPGTLPSQDENTLLILVYFVSFNDANNSLDFVSKE